METASLQSNRRPRLLLAAHVAAAVVAAIKLAVLVIREV